MFLVKPTVEINDIKGNIRNESEYYMEGLTLNHVPTTWGYKCQGPGGTEKVIRDTNTEVFYDSGYRHSS